VNAIPSINTALIEKGVNIESSTTQGKDWREDAEGAVKRQKIKSKKANIDATSDEDDFP
jgi:hypothetical protein